MNIEESSGSRRVAAEHCTGEVWIDALVMPKESDQRMLVSRARFTPRSRTAWHSHARGQFLLVVSGLARVGLRDGTVIEAGAGQIVYSPPGEEHWHGAAAGEFTEHLAMYELGEEPTMTTIWGRKVTEAEYEGC